MLITGSAGRIGLAIAKCLHAYGADLILNDINTDALQPFHETFNKERQDSCFLINSDASTEEGVIQLLSKAQQYHPRIHAAVHSAYPHSSTWGASIEHLQPSSLMQDLSLQLGSAILFSKQIIHHFQSHGGGVLLHISSIQGIGAPKFEHYQGTSMHSPIEYSAIKAGVIAITQWLAKFYANQNIRVNCISPGGIYSGQPKSFLDAYRVSCTNIGLLNPDHVAGVGAFLLSDAAVAVNGQNYIVDDGWSL